MGSFGKFVIYITWKELRKLVRLSIVIVRLVAHGKVQQDDIILITYCTVCNKFCSTALLHNYFQKMHTSRKLHLRQIPFKNLVTFDKTHSRCRVILFYIGINHMIIYTLVVSPAAPQGFRERDAIIPYTLFHYFTEIKLY